jgi:shikimate dehydrogenase
MKKFGLIGFPLTHSFSKKYFTEKFEKLGLSDTHAYELFEMEDYHDLLPLVKNTPDLKGINVTIPHKQNIIPFLDHIDPSAERIGAVNVISVGEDRKLSGYNSDYFGFRKSLQEFIPGLNSHFKALVLGFGGAAKAVIVALEDLGIEYKIVSRKSSATSVSYEDAKDMVKDHHLIINCSPVGTFPNTDQCPDINYEGLSADHYLYDLVYNPDETLFMKKGLEKGAHVINGYQMLVYQAEKAWEIWNSGI